MGGFNMNFNSNNGGGNPNHDENGRFASSNTAHGSSEETKNRTTTPVDENPEAEFKPVKNENYEKSPQEAELDEFDDYLTENEGEFDRLLKIWAKENNQDPYDLEKPVDLGELLKIKKREDATNQKIMDMGFSPDGQPKFEDQGLDTEGYANMVLDENRSIPYYGSDGKDWDTLRKNRKQLLSKEPTEKLQQIKSEINQVARRWAAAKKRKGLPQDELMALKSLLVDVNTELAKRGGK